MYVLTYTDFPINERQTPSDLNIEYWYGFIIIIFVVVNILFEGFHKLFRISGTVQG